MVEIHLRAVDVLFGLLVLVGGLVAWWLFSRGDPPEKK